MKLNRMLFFVLLLMPFFCLKAQTDSECLPTWQEGWMDIHTIATGKGDATFLILPDGTTMLIDAGDVTGGRFKAPALPDDSRRPGEWIARYILKYSAGLPHPDVLDYFWLTHFHSDHMGSPTARREGKHYGICGIMEVGEHIRMRYIVDRGYPDYNFPSADFFASKAPATFADYRKFVTYQRDNNNTQVEGFKVGTRKQFTLQNSPRQYKKNFYVWNLAGNLEVSLPDADGSIKKYQDHTEKLDENSFSGAILVKYGKFSYFNGGDIGGSPVDDRDFETDIADLTGPITVMKTNHHGWKDTCNPYFMWVTRPDVIIVPASHINHPWKATVQRIYDHQMPGKRQMFMTCDAAREQVGEELWKNIQPYFGHIVVRVYNDGSSYQVFVLNAKSETHEVLYKSNIENLTLKAEFDSNIVAYRK